MTLVMLANTINSSVKTLNKSGKFKDTNRQAAINLVQSDVFEKLDKILERDKYVDNYVNKFTSRVLSNLI